MFKSKFDAWDDVLAVDFTKTADAAAANNVQKAKDKAVKDKNEVVTAPPEQQVNKVYGVVYDDSWKIVHII